VQVEGEGGGEGLFIGEALLQVKCQHTVGLSPALLKHTVPSQLRNFQQVAEQKAQVLPWIICDN
jgi:hypothetical protein